MTGIRQSFVVSLESRDNFGKGKCQNYKWVAPPPGSYFNSTHNRSTSRIQSTGTKRWDTVAYGSLSGQWEWTFNLDYKYLTPLLFAFEKFEVVGVDENGDETSTVSEIVGYNYKFSKLDIDRVPSFTVRRKILNYMAGGPVYSDELTELRGCVCKSFRFTKSDSSSQVAVTMTGFYADEKMVTGELPSTDFQAYSGNLVEWMCMYLSDSETAPYSYEYMANTDNLGVSVENNANGVYTTCSPFAKAYYEGTTNYAFTTSCYSTNPDQYKKRLYYGGYKGWIGNTEDPSSGPGESPSWNQPLTVRPQAKGMKPIPHIRLIAYSDTTRGTSSDDIPSSPDTVDTAIANSDYRIEFDITDCVIKSLTWPKGNGGKLQDSISSAECKEISLSVYIKGERLEFDPRQATVLHAVSSGDVQNNLTRTGGGCTSGNDPTD